jgi:hypothetical protein
VHWVIGRPGLFLNTVGDIHILPKVLQAGARFETSPTDEEMATQVKELEMKPLFD